MNKIPYTIIALAYLSFARAIEVSSETQKKIGIETVKLTEKKVAPLQSITATVISSATLIDSYRQMQLADLSVSAADAASVRVEKLYADHELAALKDVEAARILKQQEILKQQSIRDKLLLEWGVYFEKLAASERQILTDSLLNGTSILLRISVPTGISLDKIPNAAVLHSLAKEHDSLRCEKIFPSPTVDPVYQSQTFFGIIETKEASLAVGTILLGAFELEGTGSQKLLISQDAVVVYLGKTWVYQQTAEDEFKRIEINTSAPCAGGWLVPLGIDQSKEIVSVGAASLLSQETMSTDEE